MASFYIPFPWQTLLDGFPVLVRIVAFAAVAPIYGATGIPSRARVAFSVLLTIVVAPILPLGAGGGLSVTSVISNTFIGLTIGFAAKLVIDAALFAGGIAGFSTGLAMANILDPVTQLSSPTLGIFYRTLALLVFIGIGGHHQILGVLVKSFHVISGSGLDLGSPWLVFAIRFTGDVLYFGFKIAAPILVTGLLVDLCLALIARAVPQMHILIVGAPVRLSCGLLAAAFSLHILAPMMAESLEASMNNLSHLLRIISGSGGAG